MKKKIWLSLLLISSLSLWACWLKKEKPEEVIKTTQINVINNMISTVVAKKDVDANWKLKLNLSSPFWWGSWEITYNWQIKWTKWNIKLWVIWNATVQWQKMWLDTSANIIITLDKIYAKLDKLSLNTSDPTLSAYSQLAKNFVWKWFFIPNNVQKNELSNAYNNLKLKEEFKKYSIFKVDEKKWDLSYKVSLNKDNLAKMIIDINKQVVKNYSWDIDGIKKAIKDEELNWLLSIDKDKTHFVFSWNVSSPSINWKLNITYKKDKFILGMDAFELNLNRNWDKFDGYILLKQQGIKVSVDGELSSDRLSLNIWYNLTPINANLNIDYTAKEIKDLKLDIPTDAIDLQKGLWALMGQWLWWNNTKLNPKWGR